MWRSKKFLLVTVLVVVVLAGSIGGVALAQAENDGDNPRHELLARVADKLGIDEQTLQDAFGEAMSELRAEHPAGGPRLGLSTELLEQFGIDESAFQEAVEQARNELEDGTLEGGRRALMTRVLQLLGIDEEEWQQAVAELCPERPEGRPFHGRPGGRLAKPWGGTPGL